MTTKTQRSLTVAAGLAALATAATVGLTGSASAAAGDPVTGGTTTFTVPSSTVLNGAASGVVAIPTSPATGSYDQANNNAVYTFPVNGGDGSVNAFYGSVNNAGGIYFADYLTHRAVTVGQLSFSIADATVSATPTGSTTPVVLFDVNGTHSFTSDRSTGAQSYTGTDVQLDAAGASFLDQALNTKAFVAGQHLGSFTTNFTNTQY